MNQFFKNHWRILIILTLSFLAFILIFKSCREEEYPPLFYEGKTAPIYDFPSQIAIKPEGISDELICGGVIIDDKWIVSAAHCFRYFDKEAKKTFETPYRELRIYSGDSKLDGQGTLSIISEVFIPESYNSQTLEDDIALIMLSEPLELNNTNRKKVKIITQNELNNIADKDIVTAVGWGRTKDEKRPMDLQRVDYPLISRDSCRKFNTMKDLVKNTMLCYGLKNISIACKGDSGSGVFYMRGKTKKLIGIVTSGGECTEIENPLAEFTMVTNLAQFQEWIRERKSFAEQSQ